MRTIESGLRVMRIGKEGLEDGSSLVAFARKGEVRPHLASLSSQDGAGVL
jgi:hypothetical protein